MLLKLRYFKGSNPALSASHFIDFTSFGRGMAWTQNPLRLPQQHLFLGWREHVSAAELIQRLGHTFRKGFRAIPWIIECRVA